MTKHVRLASFVCSFSLAAAFAFFFVIRCFDAPYKTGPLLVAGAAVLLFCVLLFWLVRRFFLETATPLSASRSQEEGRKRESLLVFGILLGVGLLFFFAAGLLCRLCGRINGSFEDALRGIWTSLDSYHYLHIAEHWYASSGDPDNVVRIVFLPGYPVAVRLVQFVFRDYFLSATLVSLFSFAGAGTFLFRLVRLDYGVKAARRAVCFFAAVPGAFFFSAPMTESLFLLCTLSSVYFMRTKKWLPAALLGSYAAFTRSVGGLLFGVFLMEAFFDAKDRFLTTDDRRVGRFFGSLSWKGAVSLCIPAGLGAYLLVNYAVFGDPLKFLQFQAEHWHQQLGWFFDTVCYMNDYLHRYLTIDVYAAVGLWGMGLFAIFAALFTLAAGGRRLRASYLAYTVVYFAVSIGATWLLSAPRYLAGLFTLPVCLALITKKKPLFFTLLPLTALLNAAYLVMFVKGWQVW